MDPFEDIFAEAAAKPAAVHSKFQPKARPGPKKGPVPKPSAAPTKEKQVVQNPLESAASVDGSLNVAINFSSDLSSIEKSKELVIGGEVTEVKYTGFGPEIVESFASKRDTDVVEMSESNVGESDISGNMTAGVDHLGFGGENLYDLLPAPSVPGGRVGGKFQPKPKETQRSEVHILDSSASLSCETNEVPGGDGCSYVKSSEEQNEDVVYHLESLDVLLTESQNKEEQTPCDFHEGNELLSSHLNNVETKGMSLSSDGPGTITETSRDMNAEKDSDLPAQNCQDTYHFTGSEVFPGMEAVQTSLEITRSSGGKFMPKPKVQNGVKKPESKTSGATFADNDHQQGPLTDFQSEYMDDGTVPCSIPEEIFQYSSIGLEESNIKGPISQPLDDVTLNDHLEPSGFDTSILEDVEYPELDPDELENLSQRPNKFSLYDVDNEEGEKSSRQLRKRVAAPLFVDESEGDAQDNEILYPEPNSSINGEDEDDESRDQSTLEKNIATRKSKASKFKDGKPSKKREWAEEASDKLKEEPEKKFSHSTRRSRRCVDRALLQTPEEEIDYQKLKIRDLILLAEHKERSAKKSAKLSRKTSTGQSLEKASDGDDAGNREGSVLHEGENSSGQPSENTEPTVTLFNYQSFMKRTPNARWSKQDTELFYEGIRQFGTDLSMIKELFPNLTRHQVKLKLKKEERQNPMRLFETLASRAKYHRHFELVIGRLQSAAQVEKESKLDNSEAVSLEDGFEDSNPETNSVSEAAKPEENKEGINGDAEGNNDELRSSCKLSENEEDDNDDEDFFGSYKSEF